MTVYWVVRRELAVMLRAPIVYLVGGLFLVVQGIAFAALVGTLADLRRPALLGALLEGQLAGTLLTWVLELVVITLLGMRAIAEDKRTGAWEALVTAGVGEGAAVVGKWLAAAAFYALIWLPTLAYPALVAIFRADHSGWDLPALAVGYAGAIALGAVLLAWAIAASAATASALAAGALGFAWLIGVFLVGELPALWPGLATDHPSVSAVLEAVSLRAIATDFARGHVAVRSLAVLAGLAVTGLALATTLACVGRRRRGESLRRALGTVACAAGAVALCVLAVRHPAGLDLSAARRNSLDDATRAVLAELPGTATLTIVAPTYGGLEPVYDEVARVLARISEAAEVATAVDVRRVDPASAPGGLTAIARAAGVLPEQLARSGAIIISVGARTRVVDLPAFGDIVVGPDGMPLVERLAIEQAVAGALAALSVDQPIRVCATRGHGELPLAPRPATQPGQPAPPGGNDWGAVAQRLRGDGMALDEVDVAAAVPAGCSVVVVAGPSQPFTDEEALALQRFVGGDRGLVVAVRGVASGAAPPTGLEGVLVAEGLGLPAARAVDPTRRPTDRPDALLISDGYADHPINRGFGQARATLWERPRVVVAVRGAKPLVSATSASWGERDLVDPPVKDLDDLAGPVALAALGSAHRVIAIGSAESFTAAVLDVGVPAADLWLWRAIRFAAGRPEPALAIAERPSEQVRLVMTEGERRAVIALSVAGIPLAWALLGGAVVWWRRRRAG